MLAKEIYRWLAAPNSSIDYLAAREKHHAQTGTWFIEGKQFIHWKETPDSALWVNGIRESGSTFLAVSILIKLQLAAERQLYGEPQYLSSLSLEVIC